MPEPVEEFGVVEELEELLLEGVVLVLPDEGVIDEDEDDGVEDVDDGVADVDVPFEVSYVSEFLLRELLLQPAKPTRIAASADAVTSFSFFAFM